jgi:hypothetical protein
MQDVPRETLILNRCVVQPQAVTSNRNQVSRRYLSMTIHRLLSDGHPAPVVHPFARLTPAACSENSPLR